MQQLELEISTLRQANGQETDARIVNLNNSLSADRQRHARQLLELTQAHEEELRRTTETLTKEYNDKVCALQEQIQSFDARLTEAVTETKSKVYEKVKQQFETGNREFQKVKALLKDANALVATKEVDISRLQAELSGTVAAAKSRDEEFASNKSYSAQLEAFIRSMVPASIDNTDIEGKLTAEMLDTAGSHIREVAVQSKKEIQALTDSVATLQQTNLSLQECVVQSQQTALAQTVSIESLNTRVFEQEKQLQELTDELATTRKDRDDQMLAVAGLASANTLLEDTLEKTKQEVADAVERASGLRAMNEELLIMLEKSV
jgi:gas vesicle protein